MKAVDSGNDALVVSGNEFVELAYEGVDRVYYGEQDMATLANVAVAFDFAVKSNATARGGDQGLDSWTSVISSVDADTVLRSTDDNGMSSFAYTVDVNSLPATFSVMLADTLQPDMGESWEPSEALTYTHTGLNLPTEENIDLGALRVTFTTQTLHVGVHRELDDRTGYTDYIGLGEGDARPEGSALDEIEISLMAPDSRGRLRVFEYDHDADSTTADTAAVAMVSDSGLVSFNHVPANAEITVVASVGSDMMIVPDARDSREVDAFASLGDTDLGAFGDMSGARPDVWALPVAKNEG